MHRLWRERLIIALSGLGLFALDWITKAIAENALTLGADPIPSPLPFISWYLSYNQGYHYIFGQLAGYRWIAGASLILALGVAVYLIHWVGEMKQGARARRVVALMAALMIGALSNPAEILLHGHATDFFRVQGFPWTANLCDQYVNLIVYVLTPILIFMLFKGWDKPPEEKDEQHEAAASGGDQTEP